MRKKKIILGLCLILIMVLVTSCFPQEVYCWLNIGTTCLPINCSEIGTVCLP